MAWRGRLWVVALAAILVLAATCRAWRLGHLELGHWDEGAYTVFARWIAAGSWSGGVPPYDPRYAPPLFPVAVGASFAVFGVSAPSAIAVSVVFGVAGVWALFLLIRSVWGTGAGLAGAALLAACAYHVIYSRMALTEAAFVFLLLLALWSYVRAVRLGRLRAYALAGAITGLCQNTKYHGLSVLVLTGLYVGVLWSVGRFQGGPSRLAGRPIRGMLVAAGITLAAYAPWAILVQAHAGYGWILSHTRTFAAFGQTPPRVLFQYARMFMTPSVLLLSLVGVLTALSARRPQGGLVLLVLGAFVVAPTAYTGYPRLLLPAAVLACGLGGVAIAWLAGLLDRDQSRRMGALRAAVAVLLSVAVSLDGLRRSAPVLTAPAAAYAPAAAAVDALPPDVPVYADVQRCMDFYLDREVTLVREGEALRQMFLPAASDRYLVTDVRVLRPRDGREAMLDYLDALDAAGLQVTALRNPLADVTLLNTLSLEDLGRVARDRESLPARRALWIAIYRIPAGWAPLSD